MYKRQPFLYGLYWKRVSRVSVWFSFLYGSGLMIANMLFRNAFPAFLQSPINAGAFAMLTGLVLVPIISLFTKAPDREIVESAFSCYNKLTEVPQSVALGEEPEIPAKK